MINRVAVLGHTPDRRVKHVKGDFKVVGKHTVHGVGPGGTVHLDLPEAQIAALLESGHLVAVPQAAEPAADNN